LKKGTEKYLTKTKENKGGSMEIKEILQFTALVVAIIGTLCLPFILLAFNRFEKNIDRVTIAIENLAESLSDFRLHVAEKYVTSEECKEERAKCEKFRGGCKA
jgi:hypothetical protein